MINPEYDEWSDAEVKKIEKTNRYFIYYSNSYDNQFYIFLGHLIDEENNNHINKDSRFIGNVTHSYRKIVIKDDDDRDSGSYEGEVINFPNMRNISEEVFESLAQSILYSIENNKYSNLDSAIKDLINFLENYSAEKSKLTLQGRFAEMLLAKKVSDLDIELAREFIKRYQKIENSTYDYPINQEYKVEVKSTRSQNFLFKIKDEQKSKNINGTSILYVFVKLTKLKKGQPGAKNIEDLNKYLKDKLNLEDDFSDSLDLQVAKFNLSNSYFDAEYFDIIYLMSDKLPDFTKYKEQYYLENIVYDVNISKLTKDIKYIPKEAETMMIEHLRKALNNG